MRPFFRDTVPVRQADMLRIPVGTSVAAAERSLILATLDHYGGDKKRSALALGISTRALQNRLDQFKNEGSAPLERRESEESSA